MKIEIKLDNSNSCEGCQFFIDQVNQAYNLAGSYHIPCFLGYRIRRIGRNRFAKKRPKECIDENGE